MAQLTKYLRDAGSGRDKIGIEGAPEDKTSPKDEDNAWQKQRNICTVEPQEAEPPDPIVLSLKEP